MEIKLVGSKEQRSYIVEEQAQEGGMRSSVSWSSKRRGRLESHENSQNANFRFFLFDAVANP